MDRRKFIESGVLGLGALALGEHTSLAQGAASNRSSAKPEDWTLVADNTKDGVRSLIVIPSPKVCPSQLDLDIYVKDRTIKGFHFTGGCPGNAQGLAKLATGMTVSEVVTRLRGVLCGRRGTSCPDQLARVLESLQW